MDLGKTAKLESSELEQVNSEGDCFQFWYYLHDRYHITLNPPYPKYSMLICISDIGLITVYLQHDGQVEELSLIDGDRGGAWRAERVPIRSQSTYKVYNLL